MFPNIPLDYPFQNKVAINRNLVDRAVCLSHEEFHSENFDFVKKNLFFNHCPQDLIEEHMKIIIQQIKIRKRRNVDTNTQSEIFDKNNTIVLPYFGQITKTIQSMLTKFQIHTIFRIPFGMEGFITLGKVVLNSLEKNGVIYKLICTRKNVEILHSESNKGKREFMEMLYIRRERTYSIHLKTDLVKYNNCYDSIISYL